MRDLIATHSLKIFSFLFVFAGTFFGPISSFLIITIFLVVTDFGTGVWAARKTKIKFNSKGMRKSITKIIGYFTAIILSRAMEIVFFEETWVQEHLPLTYMVSGFIAAVEFQSNIENIGIITGLDIWSHIKAKINTLLNSKDDESK